MSGTLRYQRQSLREALAAEYILGTLEGRARRRFVQLMGRDDSLRLLVEEMAHEAQALQAPLPPKAPPAWVWRSLDYRIRAQAAAPRRRGQGVWNSLSFWRRLSSATALVLMVMLTNTLSHTLHSHATEQVMMLVVNNDQAQPIWVIESPMDEKGGVMKVMTMKPMNTNDTMACAMWLQWPDGHVMHLTNLPESMGVVKVKLPKMERKLSQAKVMVTLEPMDKVDNMDKPSDNSSLFADYWKVI